VGNPEGKRPPVDVDVCRRIILKMYLRKTESGGMIWIYLAQGRD
jgi:hypothetical protein